MTDAEAVRLLCKAVNGIEQHLSDVTQRTSFSDSTRAKLSAFASSPCPSEEKPTPPIKTSIFGGGKVELILGPDSGGRFDVCNAESLTPNPSLPKPAPARVTEEGLAVEMQEAISATPLGHKIAISCARVAMRHIKAERKERT